MKVAIIGHGNIGKTLEQKLLKLNHIESVVIVSKKSDWKALGLDCNLVFLCIPTFDDGELALEYILHFVKKGIPVVTCEKGALANYWQTLEPFLPLIGYSATVGGGTKMLTEISNYKNKAEIQNITAVVNGTLNYISSSFKEGKKESEILQEVLLGGYAEPGANDFESIVQGELKDVVKKAVIIANHSELLDRVVKLTDVNISFNGINDLRTKRCIVKIDQNKVEAGFIEDTFASWLPSGVDNTLFINGKEVKTGPGAGADPTTHVMISDMENLMN